MGQALPKQLTKHKILNPNAQKDIQEQISQSTLKLLQNNLSELRQHLDNDVKEMAQQAAQQFKQLEETIQAQIDELLLFKLDDTLIQQLETKTIQLDNIL